MNLALPAFLTFLLILPGFIFVASYFTIGSSKLKSPPLGVKTAFALSVSFVLHWVSLALITTVRPDKVDYELVLGILSGTRIELLYDYLDLELLFNVGFYFICLFVAALALGALARSVVVITNIDRLNITERLRFTSDFAYIALGRDFTNKSQSLNWWQRFRQNCRITDSQYVGIELVTELGADLVHYTGILSRVDYSQSGEPVRLYLTSVTASSILSLEELSESVPGQPQSSNYYVFKIADIKVVGFFYFDSEDKEHGRSGSA